MPAVPARIVRLGSPRHASEGPRLGTVRRPPRGVSKAEFSSRNFYDVWLPGLAPTAELLKLAQQAVAAADEPGWAGFVRRFRSQMREPAAAQLLDALAALSHSGNFSLGCYCADAARCHRSVLRALLADRGAAIVDDSE